MTTKTKTQSARDIAIEAAQSAAPKISDSEERIRARMARIARMASLSEQESAELLGRTIKSLPVKTVKPSLPPGVRLGSSVKDSLAGLTLGEVTPERIASACKVAALAGDGTAEVGIAHRDQVRSSVGSPLIDATDADCDTVASGIARHFGSALPTEDEIRDSDIVRAKLLLDKARRGGR